MDSQTATTFQAYASIALTILTAATLGVLIWYTVETSKLRKTAQAQTAESANLLEEAQIQNETALRPIVALSIEHTLITDSERASSDTRLLKLRNLGKGPAFNVMIATLDGDDDAKYAFFHPDCLAEGESSQVHLGAYDNAGTPLMMTWQAIEELIYIRQVISLPQMLTVNYRSATGKVYETVQRLDGRTPETTDLEFDKTRLVPAFNTPPTA
ncbi:MAG: hypothetical protein LC114_03640 [Bryobacterales bacterium]|nr:hypothetical protein [Bryobacterales bacterium]